MESNPIHLPYAQRLQNKLDFLEKTKTFNLDQHQKESIQNQLDAFIKLAQNIKDMDSQNPLVDSFYKHLYKKCKKFERQVLFWLRLNLCDVDTFKLVSKEKGKQYLSIMDEIPAPVKTDGITIENLNNLNFPCLVYSNQELCQFSEMIFKEQNLLGELNISSEKLNKIILTICAGYNVIPYHNFSHGFNVFQMFYTLVKRTELQTILEVSEKFLIFLAALGHDLNHRGFNNLGESKIRSKASLTYYDQSILENMHTSKLLEILKLPEINLIEHFPNPAKRAQFKEMIISVILATDVAYHHKRLVKLTENVNATVAYKKAIANNEEILPEIEEKRIKLDNPAHRKRIIKNVVHACDIGNPAQEYDLFLYWSTLVTQEFDHQTKVEHKRGVEVTTYMKYQNLAVFYETQISFAKNLALPLWEQIGILFEGAQEGVETMKINIKKLEGVKAKAQVQVQAQAQAQNKTEKNCL